MIDGLHEDSNLWMLRPGGITVEDIERSPDEDLGGSDAPVPKALVHKRDHKDEDTGREPTTPGTKYRHYQPRSIPT